MSSFILHLLIISAFGLMVQSAPEHVTKRSTMSNEERNQRELENNLYCTAQSLHITGGQLRKTSYTLPSLPKIDVNSNTKGNMNRMLHHFSNLCKYFTIAMTLKHQLQEHLFTTDTVPELTSDNAKKLSTILTNLQTMAKIFDAMQFNEDNSRCVKLTPAQYKIMYYVRYTAPLLESLKDNLQGWYLDPSLYEYEDERHCYSN